MIDRDRLCKALDGAILICMDLFVVGVGLIGTAFVRGLFLDKYDELNHALSTASLFFYSFFFIGHLLTYWHQRIEPRYSEDDT